MKLVRETRDGALYQPEFGLRQRGSGVYADLLAQRFKRAEQRLGLNRGGFKRRGLGDLDCSINPPPPTAHRPRFPFRNRVPRE